MEQQFRHWTQSLLIVAALASAGGPMGSVANAAPIFIEPGSPIYRSLAVASGNGASCGNDALVEGHVHSNGSATVHPSCRVAGDVSATGTVSNQGTVEGAVTSGVAQRPLPAIPSDSALEALADRVIIGDTQFTNAIVDDVVLVRGALRIAGTLAGQGTLIATGDVRLDAVGVGASIDPDMRLSIIARGDVWIGQSRRLRAVVLAGRDVEVHQSAEVEGVLVAGRDARLHLGATARFTELIDRQAPQISELAPAGGSFVASRRPEVRASFSDEGSGVDPSTVRLVLDGVDRTTEAAISGSEVRFESSVDLADGAHALHLELADRAGNPARADWSFAIDSTPSVLSFSLPEADLVTSRADVEIVVTWIDAGSGSDPAGFRLMIDGMDATGACQVESGAAQCVSQPLATGLHELVASVRDRVGNTGETTLLLDLVVDQSAPTVTVLDPEDGAFTSLSLLEVRGQAADDVEVTSVLVSGVEASLAGGAFSAPVELRPGANGLLVVATDAMGRQTASSLTVVLDQQGPTIELESPRDGQLFNGEMATVEGRVAEVYGGATLTVDGVPVELIEGRFTSTVALLEGENAIALAATDRAGNRTDLVVDVRRYSLPEIEIVTPTDLSYLAETTITVSGSASAETASVAVNGVEAVLAGGSFTANGVPLIEGGNTVTATARDDHGHVSTDTIHVVRDQTPPHVSIYQPVAGVPVYEASTSVQGLVNDIVPGTVNSSEATVTVNGLPADVVNRSFLVRDVPLEPGDNVLTAVAIDASGNRGEASITVRRNAQLAARAIASGGNHQSAVIRSPLPESLVAELSDANGAPVAGEPVVFRVVTGDGALADGKRAVVVTTDSTGRAATTFRVGNRVGVGNHVVHASAVGFAGPAVFVASGEPGPPALVVVDAGGLQTGVAGRSLPRPLVAAVVDAGSNRLPEVPVTFRVTKGLGRFANGLPEMEVATDSDGRAILALILDPAEGAANNVVEARLREAPDGPVAGFVASGLAAGDPSLTSVSGVVLDNTNAPIEGVSLRIKDTALVTTTDAQGQFRIPGTPVGAVKLVVDGSTAHRPGAWPDLEFDLVTIPGRDTTANMPIYLLPLELDDGVYVDETNGATLVLAEFPGFALEVAPGSVTFPGGGRSGLISATVVHNDKVPMVPNFGQQPRFIVTIQPAGARFDPPARLTLPNVEGLEPGLVSEMYSFDHDLGHFVSIGPATVSNDGTTLQSDKGVGIVKAGWHCGGNPGGTGSAHKCGPCTVCNGQSCVAGCALPLSSATVAVAAACACSDGDQCTFDDTCSGETCTPGQPVRIDSIDAVGNGRQLASAEIVEGRATVIFELDTVSPNPTGCPDLLVEWDLGDGTRKTGLTVHHDYTQAGLYRVTATAKCASCALVSASDTVLVDVLRVAMRMELVGGVTISRDGDYFEEARIRLTAVREGTDRELPNYAGVALLEEAGAFHAYDHNDGELPAEVDIVNGVGTATLRSRAGADGDQVPPPASIRVSNYPMVNGPLSVPQWVDSQDPDPLAQGAPTFDWLETMILDARTGLSGSTHAGQVVGDVSGYRVNLSLGQRRCGHYKAENVPTTEIELNPTCLSANAMRVNGDVETVCGFSYDHAMANVLIHEARHVHQNLLRVRRDLDAPNDGAGENDNDDDGDHLVDRIPIPPFDFIRDDPRPRPGCDAESNVETEVWFSGDAHMDIEERIRQALEWDAYVFARDNQ